MGNEKTEKYLQKYLQLSVFVKIIKESCDWWLKANAPRPQPDNRSFTLDQWLSLNIAHKDQTKTKTSKFIIQIFRGAGMIPDLCFLTLLLGVDIFQCVIKIH